MDDFFNDPSRNLFEPIKSATEVNRLRAEAYDYGKPYTEAKRTEMLRQAGYLAKKSGMATAAYQRAAVYRKQACLPVTNRASSEPPTPKTQSPWDVLQQVGNNLRDYNTGYISALAEGYVLPQLYTASGVGDELFKFVFKKDIDSNTIISNFYNTLKANLDSQVENQLFYSLGRTVGSASSIGLSAGQMVLGAQSIVVGVEGIIAIVGGGTFFTGGSGAVVAIAISTPLIASVAVSAGAIATAGISFEYSVGQFREDLDRAVEEIQKAANFNKADDRYLKSKGIDAHQLKKDYLGEKAQIAQYDIYINKSDGRLWIFRKGGQGTGIETSEFIK